MLCKQYLFVYSSSQRPRIIAETYHNNVTSSTRAHKRARCRYLTTVSIEQLCLCFFCRFVLCLLVYFTVQFTVICFCDYSFLSTGGQVTTGGEFLRGDVSNKEMFAVFSVNHSRTSETDTFKVMLIVGFRVTVYFR